jgi:hypothetical protein
MIITDYVFYNGELIIEFILKDLNKYADKVIIAESIYTHPGNGKMIYLLT